MLGMLRKPSWLVILYALFIIFLTKLHEINQVVHSSEFINLNLITTIMSVFIGALVTFIAAKFYYVKASQDLTAEAKELKHLNILILRGLEEAGLVKYDRDDNGDIKGFVITGTGKLMAPAVTIKAEATVIRKEK